MASRFRDGKVSCGSGIALENRAVVLPVWTEGLDPRSRQLGPERLPGHAKLAWEEVFYVDLEANLDDLHVKQALEELKEHTQYTRVLGCYQSESLQAVSV